MSRDIFFIIVCLIGIYAIYYGCQNRYLPQDTSIISIIGDVTATHRPRVVYFYADRASECVRFAPTLKETIAIYGSTIDLQPVDVDDVNNRALAGEFHITVVPTIYVFDSKGKAFFFHQGYVNQGQLNEVLRKVYVEATTGAVKERQR
jgi:thioredoxin-like negative regulator of GroEL